MHQSVKRVVASMLKSFFSQGGILNILRLIVGVASLVLGIWVLSGKAVSLAVILFGAATLGHALIDEALQSLREDKTYSPPDATSGMRDFASAFVTTSGVILGLLAVFGDHKFSQVTELGIWALVVDILVGTVLVGLLLAAPAETANENAAWNLIRYVFNVAMWGLTLGLVCIAVGLVFR